MVVFASCGTNYYLEQRLLLSATLKLGCWVYGAAGALFDKVFIDCFAGRA